MNKVFDFVGLVLSKAFKSKTLIVGWLTLIASTLTLWSGSEVVAQYPQVVSGLGVVLGVVTLVLRYATTLPLSDR